MRAQEIVPRKLVIFDIDDTLVHSQAKIEVKTDGQSQTPPKFLTSQEFTHYKFQPNETPDFGQFRSAEEFFKNSKPIIPMIGQLNKDIDTGNKVALVTARESMDDVELFKQTFKKFGVHIDRAELFFGGGTGSSIPAHKAKIISNLLKQDKFNKAIMYDDSKSNLIGFINLSEKFPNTRFYAWWVNPTTGIAQELVRSNPPPNILRESKDMVAHKDNFVDMFDKFLPIAMHYLKIKHLPDMRFQLHIDDTEQPTFGKYENESHILHVALINRHPNDILRTIAHELTHYKQDVEDRLNPNSGATGSPEENQANQLAGIIMRHFNKRYPEFLSSEPITK